MAAREAEIARLRDLCNEFLDATERVIEIAGKIDSDVWYRLTRVREKALRAAGDLTPTTKKVTHICAFDFLDDGSIGCERCNDNSRRTT